MNLLASDLVFKFMIGISRMKTVWNIWNKFNIQRIDHVYTTCQENLQRMFYSSEAYSDHQLIMFSINVKTEMKATNPL